MLTKRQVLKRLAIVLDTYRAVIAETCSRVELTPEIRAHLAVVDSVLKDVVLLVGRMRE